MFSEQHTNRLLFSNIKVSPSTSPFIKNRLEIISYSRNYLELLDQIRGKDIRTTGFKVEYLILDGDETNSSERKKKMKDVGYRIPCQPDFKTPSIVYGICYCGDTWYFGILESHTIDWLDHKQKPFSFSNSIGMKIAKSLVTIASKGDKAVSLLDSCCGVGTIMLEACISGFNIEGCDINPKRCEQTQRNLEHYGYHGKVHCSDVSDLDKAYDAVIVDLPYNLYSYSTDAITESIIQSAANKSTRVVIVSIADIKEVIDKADLSVMDFCTVEKRGKSGFTRSIWVCEKV